MTREELDFIGSMNMCDEISNEAYKKIVCHCEEQEPCEDAISRQAAIDAVAFGITYATGVNMETGEVSYPFAESNQELRKAIHRICELPPVNPQEPKTGHWIDEIDDYGKVICWHCDKCYEDSGFTTDCKWKYCPSCGAKMIEPQER